MELDKHAQYSAVWLKEMAFSKGQTRKVIVEYDANLASRTDITAAYYILRSGATWRGVIESCRVVVDSTGLIDRGEPDFALAQMPLYGDAIVHGRELRPGVTEFQFKNLKPNFDLEMIWPNGFWKYRINGRKPHTASDGTGFLFAGGTSRDPVVAVSGIPNLLASKSEFDKIDSGNPLGSRERSATVQGRVIRFLDKQNLDVDGKAVKLSRPTFIQDSIEWVFVRDLVAALGGDCRFDKKTGRVEIKLPTRGSG